MNKIQTHSRSSRENKITGLASKIFFSLALLILFSLPGSAQAYEWDKKALEEASNMDFPKPEEPTPFGRPQKKGYIFGIKMNFEVNTIWSVPKDNLKSEQLTNNFFGEDYFSGVNNASDELPLEMEMPSGATPAKLIEIRF
jgi:hypothetical protein